MKERRYHSGYERSRLYGWNDGNNGAGFLDEKGRGWAAFECAINIRKKTRRDGKQKRARCEIFSSAGKTWLQPQHCHHQQQQQQPRSLCLDGTDQKPTFDISGTVIIGEKVRGERENPAWHKMWLDLYRSENWGSENTTLITIIWGGRTAMYRVE